MSTLGSVATGKDAHRGVLRLVCCHYFGTGGHGSPVFTGTSSRHRLLSVSSDVQTSAPRLHRRRSLAAAASQPGLWHRTNRTASCVGTASCGRSPSAAASRQAHRTALCGESDPVTAAQLPTTRQCGTGTSRSDAGSTDQNVSRAGSRIRHLVRALRHRRLPE